MALILLPLGLLVALMVCLQHKGQVLYMQQRPGKYGVPFFIYKFRTMYELKDTSGKLLPDESRTSRLGAFLRRTSLDELPQLMNVMKGDMSIVGPRPLLMEYLPLYSEEQKARHALLPGMTGWAQVNKEKAILWTEKFNLDRWYVENISFILDLKILLLTAVQIFTRNTVSDSSIYQGKFKGN